MVLIFKHPLVNVCLFIRVCLCVSGLSVGVSMREVPCIVSECDWSRNCWYLTVSPYDSFDIQQVEVNSHYQACQ